MPYADGLSLVGTLPFASLGSHLGQGETALFYYIDVWWREPAAQSRRDDLQSLSYILALFARGSLPWDTVAGGTQTHRERRVQEKKRSWTAARLFYGLPQELETFANHCFSLGFDEHPKYNFLRQNLKIIMDREGWSTADKYEWEVPGWNR
jgi:hypothetical protein